MRRRVSNYVILYILFSGIIVTLGFAQEAEKESVKVGVINSQKVLEDSSAGKKVLAQLQDRDQKIQAELVKLDNEIQELETKLNTQRLTLSEESIFNYTSDLERKRTDRKRRAEDAYKDLQELQLRLFNRVQSELLPLIEQIGKDKGFDLIFDLAKSGAIYFNPVIDVTDELIKRYDASASKKK